MKSRAIIRVSWIKITVKMILFVKPYWSLVIFALTNNAQTSSPACV
jgi:hypothetical protein